MWIEEGNNYKYDVNRSKFSDKKKGFFREEETNTNKKKENNID